MALYLEKDYFFFSVTKINPGGVNTDKIQIKSLILFHCSGSLVILYSNEFNHCLATCSGVTRKVHVNITDFYNV